MLFSKCLGAWQLIDSDPKKIVAFAILAWSTLTALTGAAAGYRTLVLIRFAFGGMEAALAPAIGTSLTQWVPEKWRTTAFGIFLAGGRLGGAFAPAGATALLLHFGWRSTFLIIAAAGPVAAFLWIRAIPSGAGAESTPKPLERKEKQPRSFRLFALLLVVFGYTFEWQFYATWFPTYLIERRGFSLSQASGYAALPFLLGIGSNWMGGFLCDVLSRKLGRPFGRGAMGVLSMFLTGLLFYFGVVGSTRTSVWLLAAAAGFGDLFLPIAWSVATELGGKSAGAFAGLMNSASNLGGFVSPIVLGAAIQRSGNWDSALIANVAAAFGAALLWPIVIWPVRSKASCPA
jgi:ACS family glucarate transporter-like MFS transporter